MSIIYDLLTRAGLVKKKKMAARAAAFDTPVYASFLHMLEMHFRPSARGMSRRPSWHDCKFQGTGTAQVRSKLAFRGHGS